MDDDGRRQVSALLRSISEHVATDDPVAGDWADVTARLAAVDGAFEADGAARTRFARGLNDGAAHPLSDATSPVYPPLEVSWEPPLLVARTSFGAAWEGPPDLVHGGFLAAGFDMVLSAMAHRVLNHSVTRRLQVRYLKPTFLGAALRYEVEADEPNGRLLDLRGRLYADDRVTMRASAQFARLDPDRFADRRPTPG